MSAPLLPQFPLCTSTLPVYHQPRRPPLTGHVGHCRVGSAEQEAGLCSPGAPIQGKGEQV